MVLNLMGIPTNLPLYDSQGNLIQDDYFNMNFIESDSLAQDFSERESTEQEQRDACILLNLVREQLAMIDNIGADLLVSEDVSVYSYEDPNTPDSIYYAISVHGGKNGSGLWSNYFKSLADLMLRLESIFNDVWIRKWNVDCPDDVFDVEVAICPYLSQLS